MFGAITEFMQFMQSPAGQELVNGIAGFVAAIGAIVTLVVGRSTSERCGGESWKKLKDVGVLKRKE